MAAMTADISTMAAGLLAAVAAGGVAYVLLYPLIAGGARAEKRQKALVGTRERRGAQSLAVNRRDQVAQSLKELEQREKARNRVTIETRLAQAGLSWDRKRFFIVSGIIGLAVGLLFFSLTANLTMGLAGLFIGVVGLPRWWLAFRKNRRINRFLDELPNAMDVIVRGIRAGLPIGDCLRIIASEAQEPVRSEFRTIVEAQTLGVSVGDAVAKLYERVPVPESNFFAIVIGIQQKAGGNLSETLSNLSKVLRERKKMAGKIKAMSMEAKASAGIIACLPPTVAILTYLSSPRYIELLWLTQSGKIALGACALWMATGVFVMKKMIAFDY
jgi:tight adherence protein B